MRQGFEDQGPRGAAVRSHCMEDHLAIVTSASMGNVGNPRCHKPTIWGWFIPGKKKQETL